MSETPDLRAKILDYIRENPGCEKADLCAHAGDVERELWRLNDDGLVTIKLRFDAGRWVSRLHLAEVPPGEPVSKPRYDRKRLERQRQKLLITIGAFAKLVPEHTATLAAMQDQIENMRPAPPKASRKSR